MGPVSRRRRRNRCGSDRARGAPEGEHADANPGREGCVVGSRLRGELETGLAALRSHRELTFRLSLTLEGPYPYTVRPLRAGAQEVRSMSSQMKVFVGVGGVLIVGALVFWLGFANKP